MAKEGLKLEFGNAISRFEQAMKKFQIRRVIYRSVFRGKGLEFDSYREFGPTEDASLIDWKASRRSGKLMARSYIEERDLTVYFIVDAGSNMLFGSGNKLKAEYAGEVTSVLSHLIVNSGDSASLMMFNDGVSKYLPPSKTQNQFFMITKFLSDIGFYGRRADFRIVLSKILSEIHNPSSLIVLISDFNSMNKGIDRELKLLSSKFETIAFMVRDPLDEQLPSSNNQVVFEDPQSGKQLLVDPAIASEVYKKEVLRHKAKIKQIFLESGIDLLELNTHQDFVVPIASFLRSRARGGSRL